MLRHVKHPFPAVTSKNARILILGSVPSIKSVENGFYYMHPQNRFWRVLSRLFDEDFTAMSKVEKSAALIRHDIALYDSVEECDIESSKDSAIYNVIPADIEKIISETKNRAHILQRQSVFQLSRQISSRPCRNRGSLAVHKPGKRRLFS